MTKFCPLLMQGLMATMIEEARPSTIRETVTDERMTACIGSRCAFWEAELRPVHDEYGSLIRDGDSYLHAPTGRGRCGMAKGDSFEDPAGGSDD